MIVTRSCFASPGWVSFGKEIRRVGEQVLDLATALVAASHQAALTRGVDRAVLQATGSGIPWYAKTG